MSSKFRYMCLYIKSDNEKNSYHFIKLFCAFYAEQFISITTMRGIFLIVFLVTMFIINICQVESIPFSSCSKYGEMCRGFRGTIPCCKHLKCGRGNTCTIPRHLQL